MHEATISWNLDNWYNSSLVHDPNFVYGHYQIGGDTAPSSFSTYRMRNLNRGFATIGGLRVGRYFYYAVALCSPRDNFSKRVGRNLVREHLSSSSASHMRGVMNISGLEDLQPALVLKNVLERHLQKARHLPPWTRQTVLFRKSRYMPDSIRNPVMRTRLAAPQRDPKRREAALKAWETRRRNARISNG